MQKKHSKKRSAKKYFLTTILKSRPLSPTQQSLTLFNPVLLSPKLFQQPTAGLLFTRLSLFESILHCYFSFLKVMSCPLKNLWRVWEEPLPSRHFSKGRVQTSYLPITIHDQVQITSPNYFSAVYCNVLSCQQTEPIPFVGDTTSFPPSSLLPYLSFFPYPPSLLCSHWPNTPHTVS